MLAARLCVYVCMHVVLQDGVCMLLNHVCGTTVCIFGWEFMYLCMDACMYACVYVCAARSCMYVCVCGVYHVHGIYAGSSCVAAKAYIKVRHRMLIRKK